MDGSDEFELKFHELSWAELKRFQAKHGRLDFMLKVETELEKIFGTS